MESTLPFNVSSICDYLVYWLFKMTHSSIGFEWDKCVDLFAARFVGAAIYQ